MMDEISGDERRRRAPAHYYARADNARYSSYILTTLRTPFVDEAANAIHYRGSPDISLGQAARREMSIALELIIKAVIAQRIENGERLAVTAVPMTHDIKKLWQQARLPRLEEADDKRLQAFGVIMTWAGRYPAPSPGGEGNPSRQYPTEVVRDFGKLQIVRNVQIAWGDFERIYQVVQRVLIELSPRVGD